jgi:hypothetical protein
LLATTRRLARSKVTTSRICTRPLIEFGASIGVAVSCEPIPGAARGFYDHDGDRIVVGADTETSANSELKTLIHELAHALIRREHRDEDPELRRGEEEVVVECVAYTGCSSVGLDTAGNSVPYVASWSEGGEIERYAALIDRLAEHSEEAASPRAPGSAARKRPSPESRGVRWPDEGRKCPD